ncbi:MAG: CBS domain-containing protein [Actinomycetota bacterium]|nr:CBS domain-containing protein [Actinomycetota bacterium]
MSPRAAWRLERLGFNDVYDFVPGKVAWLAMGWPREGTAAAIPNAGEVARRRTPTCSLEDRIGDVRDKVLEAGRHVCIVVNEKGIVEGRLRRRALEENPGATAEDAMEIGPTTIRPSEPLEPLVGRMRRRGVATIVVSDLKGRLVGILYREDVERALEAARRSAGASP